MNRKNSNSKIEHRLEELREVPPRNPKQAAQGRANFLSEAAKYRQAVSPATNSRQSVWTSLIRKEKFAMNALISLILAFTMVLGGGVTAVAAQNDLPNQALYPVKLWTENATLALTGDPGTKANLLMNMAQTRVEEMAALAEMGITPPDQVRERLEQHLHQTLMLAADMDAATRDQLLLQLRDQMQTQDRIMEQLQLHVNAETDPLLTRTRQMLQTKLQLVDKGLADPQGFQYMMQNQMQYGQEEGIQPEPNQQGGPDSQQNGLGGQGVEAPGNSNGGETPGGENPDNSQGTNGGNGSGNETSGGQNPESPQGGSGNGSGGKP